MAPTRWCPSSARPSATGSSTSRAPSGVGDHVREIGSDLSRGAEVLPAGVAIVPLALAALSAAGIAEIAVHRRPRVAIVVTGDELRTPPEPLRRGQIYESNGSFLAARSSSLGAEVVRVERVADDAARDPRGLRARARRGRSRAGVRRRLGRAARPREARPARARRARAVLAHRAAAGQARLGRRARRTPRHRAARQPALGAGRLRAARPAGAAAPLGHARPGAVAAAPAAVGGRCAVSPTGCARFPPCSRPRPCGPSGPVSHISSAAPRSPTGWRSCPPEARMLRPARSSRCCRSRSGR